MHTEHRRASLRSTTQLGPVPCPNPIYSRTITREQTFQRVLLRRLLPRPPRRLRSPPFPYLSQFFAGTAAFRPRFAGGGLVSSSSSSSSSSPSCASSSSSSSLPRFFLFDPALAGIAFPFVAFALGAAFALALRAGFTPFAPLGDGPSGFFILTRAASYLSPRGSLRYLHVPVRLPERDND